MSENIYIYLTVFDSSASQRVPGEPEISLVSRAGDLRSGDFRSTESSEGDVRGEGDEEQNYQLRAGVSWELRAQRIFYILSANIQSESDNIMQDEL